MPSVDQHKRSAGNVDDLPGKCPVTPTQGWAGWGRGRGRGVLCRKIALLLIW